MVRGNQVGRHWAVIKTLDGRLKRITIIELCRDLNSGLRIIWYLNNLKIRKMVEFRFSGYFVEREKKSGNGAGSIKEYASGDSSKEIDSSIGISIPASR